MEAMTKQTQLERERAQLLYELNGHKYPYIVQEDDPSKWRALSTDDQLPIPYIGRWRPKGFKLVKDITVSTVRNDRSYGRITMEDFIDQVRVGSAYAVIASRGFVNHVAEFTVDPAA